MDNQNINRLEQLLQGTKNKLSVDKNTRIYLKISKEGFDTATFIEQMQDILHVEIDESMIVFESDK